MHQPLLFSGKMSLTPPFSSNAFRHLHIIELPLADGHLLKRLGYLPYNTLPKRGLAYGTDEAKAVKSYLRHVLRKNLSLLGPTYALLAGCTGFPETFAHRVSPLPFSSDSPLDTVLDAYTMRVARELASKRDGGRSHVDSCLPRARGLVEDSGLRARLEKGDSRYLFSLNT